MNNVSVLRWWITHSPSLLIMGIRCRSQISSVQLWRPFILIQLTKPSQVKSPIVRSYPRCHSINFPTTILKKSFRTQTSQTMSWKLRLLSILPSLVLSYFGIEYLLTGNIRIELWISAELGSWAWFRYSLSGLCSSFCWIWLTELRSHVLFVVAEAKMPIFTNAGRPARETGEAWKCRYSGEPQHSGYGSRCNSLIIFVMMISLRAVLNRGWWWIDDHLHFT